MDSVLYVVVWIIAEVLSTISQEHLLVLLVVVMVKEVELSKSAADCGLKASD